MVSDVIHQGRQHSNSMGAATRSYAGSGYEGSTPITALTGSQITRRVCKAIINGVPIDIHSGIDDWNSDDDDSGRGTGASSGGSSSAANDGSHGDPGGGDDDDSPTECPLCMDPFELDDLNFYPCACGYQICRFCWNRIRTEESGLCPACRSVYAENPVDFKPLSVEDIAKIKAKKRQKDQAKKVKVSECRRHLANVRVVQRNLVFVVGLPTRLADAEVLRRTEYFGKFGKIHKAVVNHSTSYAGCQQQGPSASAYVTYYKSEDALRAIQAVSNLYIDNRPLKASLGTTKYCAHFMKNLTCPKHDCMYLHELGDEAASFTKEEMQQGKHTEYERTLHESLLTEPNLQQGQQQNLSSSASSGGHVSVQNFAQLGSKLSSSKDETPTAVGALGVGSIVATSTAPSSSIPSSLPQASTAHREGRIQQHPTASSNSQSTTAMVYSSQAVNVTSASWNGKCTPENGDKVQYADSGHGSGLETSRSDDIPCPAVVCESESLRRLSGENDDCTIDGIAEGPTTAERCDSATSAPTVVAAYDQLHDEDDGLGFDPFAEMQKGFAQLLENEQRSAAAAAVAATCAWPDPMPAVAGSIDDATQEPMLVLEHQQAAASVNGTAAVDSTRLFQRHLPTSSVSGVTNGCDSLTLERCNLQNSSKAPPPGFDGPKMTMNGDWTRDELSSLLFDDVARSRAVQDQRQQQEADYHRMLQDSNMMSTADMTSYGRMQQSFQQQQQQQIHAYEANATGWPSINGGSSHRARQNGDWTASTRYTAPSSSANVYQPPAQMQVSGGGQVKDIFAAAAAEDDAFQQQHHHHQQNFLRQPQQHWGGGSSAVPTSQSVHKCNGWSSNAAAPPGFARPSS